MPIPPVPVIYYGKLVVPITGQGDVEYFPISKNSPAQLPTTFSSLEQALEVMGACHWEIACSLKFSQSEYIVIILQQPYYPTR